MKHNLVFLLLVLAIFSTVAGAADRQVVVNQTSKIVLRHGFCDFSSDGTWDVTTHEAIISTFCFYPTIKSQSWWYHTTDTSFKMVAP